MQPADEGFEREPSLEMVTPRPRLAEPMKLLPVMFVSSTILGLYLIYVIFHCIPGLQIGKSAEHRDDAERRQAIKDTVAFHFITFMVLWCYLRCIFSSPGEIPVNDPQWEYVPLDGKSPGPPVPPGTIGLKETKRTGDRRHCKWCGKYKPDRCHHCRVCRMCILKMDHHCPWIFNCVGHGNYKYFFLLLLFSVIDLHYIVWTMAPSVQSSMVTDTPVTVMFFLLFGETLASFLVFLLNAFFAFHIWLTLRAMTTIEFCEKSLPSKPGEAGSSGYRSSYDQGAIRNLTSVLGSNPFMMFLPITPSPGDGLSFVNETARLNQKASRGPPPRPQQRSNGGAYGAYGQPDESLDAVYYGYGDQPLPR